MGKAFINIPLQYEKTHHNIFTSNFNTNFWTEKQYFCMENPLMNTATVSCETFLLQNNSKLYWQNNCNRIWLTLENGNCQKIVLDKVNVNLFPYTYRISYHLIKEFKNGLLFRSDFTANEPCVYILVDKMMLKKYENSIS